MVIFLITMVILKNLRVIMIILLLFNPCKEYIHFDNVAGASVVSTNVTNNEENNNVTNESKFTNMVFQTNTTIALERNTNATDQNPYANGSHIAEHAHFSTDSGKLAITADQKGHTTASPIVEFTSVTIAVYNTTAATNFTDTEKKGGENEESYNYDYSSYYYFNFDNYYYYDSSLKLVNSINETLRNETNQTLKELLQVQMNACPYTDLCLYSKILEPSYEKPSCKSCSCHKSCKMFGTCCLDSPDADVKPTFLNGTCVTPQYFSNSVIQGDSYYMVMECPVSETNNTLRYLCEQAELDLIDSLPVVTTSDYPITFKNQYCAHCHNEISYEKFKLKLQCKYNKIYNKFQIAGLINELNQKRDSCNALYVSPEEDPYNRCYPDVISKCNTTGYWEKHDELIENACHKYTMIYEFGSKQYKNAFCYLCNGKDHYLYQNDYNFGYSDSGSFTSVVDTNVLEKLTLNTALDKCTTHEIYDYVKDTCRSIGCSDLLYYDGNKCIPVIVGNSVTQHISVKFELVVSKESYTWSTIGLIFAHKLEQYIYFNLRNFRMCWAAVYIQKDSPGFTSSYKKYYMYVQFKVESWDSDYFEFVRTMIKLGSVIHDIPAIQIISYIDNVPTIPDIFGNDLIDWFSNVEYLSPFSNHEYCSFWSYQITTLSLCPKINIDSSDYSFQNTNGKLCFEDVHFCLRRTEYIPQSNTTISVCIDTFLSLMKRLKSPYQKYKHQILSTLSSVISLLCLGVTLTTYFLFKEMRTLPGYNNMLLTFSSFLSHLALCFNSLLEFDNNLYCLTTGVAVHFLWLNFVACLNICCVHAYITFVKLSKCFSPVYDKWSRLILYLIWSVIYPTVFILINLFNQKFTENVPYLIYEAGNICFISTLPMILLTFILPVCLPILANITLLLSGVITILRKPVIWENVKDQHQNLKLFVGLSTLTGAVVCFGVLSQLTNHIVFVYMFSLSIGLHGVAFLLAFVFNKRVWNLYKSLFFRGDHKPGKISEPTGQESNKDEIYDKI